MNNEEDNSKDNDTDERIQRRMTAPRRSSDVAEDLPQLRVEDSMAWEKQTIFLRGTSLQPPIGEPSLPPSNRRTTSEPLPYMAPPPQPLSRRIISTATGNEIEKFSSSQGPNQQQQQQLYPLPPTMNRRITTSTTTGNIVEKFSNQGQQQLYPSIAPEGSTRNNQPSSRPSLIDDDEDERSLTERSFAEMPRLQRNVRYTEPETPGAVAISAQDLPRSLVKGRLTEYNSNLPPAEESREFLTNGEGQEGLNELSQAQSPPPAATATPTEPQNDLPPRNVTDASPPPLRDAKAPRSWWRSTTFKIVAAVVLTSAIAVAVAVPLSVQNNNNNSSAAQPTEEAATFEERKEAIETLVSLAVSDPTTLTNSTSPQSLALNWSIYKDEQSPLDTKNFGTFADKLIQRFAFSVFFFASGGPTSWISTRSWLGGNVNECEWNFIECHNDGHVSSIDFINGNNVTDLIPPELSLLSSLDTLGLLKNPISHLPRELSRLVNLTRLDMDSTKLSGPFPSVIYELKSLKSLLLGENALNGTISSSISKLSHLLFLDLRSNQFSGRLPVESINPSILDLVAGNGNQFVAELPDILTRLPNLVVLNMPNNLVAGPIPSEIGNLKNLTTLALDSNQLSSSLPSEIGLATTLKQLTLRDVGLNGTIPVELSNLSNLEVLEVSANPLSGSVPDEICQLLDGVLTRLLVPCSMNCECCTCE